LLRSGAQAGDDIYVSGTLGDAAGGLELVMNPSESDLSDMHQRKLIARYTDPVPRLGLGQALRGVASAVIDISDGFASDLNHLCRASGVGAEVLLDSLPLSEALVKTYGREKASSLAVRGGDDYELCFTAPHRLSDVVASMVSSVGCRVTKVGHINADQTVDFIDNQGNSVSLTAGYTHF
jgi:thiamine-monophosphate kinase